MQNFQWMSPWQIHPYCFFHLPLQFFLEMPQLVVEKLSLFSGVFHAVRGWLSCKVPKWSPCNTVKGMRFEATTSNLYPLTYSIMRGTLKHPFAFSGALLNISFCGRDGFASSFLNILDEIV